MFDVELGVEEGERAAHAVVAEAVGSGRADLELVAGDAERAFAFAGRDGCEVGFVEFAVGSDAVADGLAEEAGHAAAGLFIPRGAFADVNAEAARGEEDAHVDVVYGQLAGTPPESDERALRVGDRRVGATEDGVGAALGQHQLAAGIIEPVGPGGEAGVGLAAGDELGAQLVWREQFVHADACDVVGDRLCEERFVGLAHVADGGFLVEHDEIAVGEKLDDARIAGGLPAAGKRRFGACGERYDQQEHTEDEVHAGTVAC